MKYILVAMIALFLGTTAHAEISNSSYDARHQALLEKAILESCSAGYGLITQISSIETENRVDQGVVDLYFTTNLEMTVRVDQGAYDTYVITAYSAMYSGYDHNAKDWGYYSVESVVCELK